MSKVTDRVNGRSISFELWPPRSPETAASLELALSQLPRIDPAFIAITYGAGGSTRERTRSLVERLVRTGPPPLAHVTCAAHRRAELVELISHYRRAGVSNLLALQGDPPLSATAPLPPGELRYAVDLLRLARELGIPCVGVAVHPEGHPASATRESDLDHQAAKLRESDFGLTQFFYRAADYFTLVEEMRARGATAPIIPGIMPSVNLRQAERMAAMSGATLPPDLVSALGAATDLEHARAIGVEHARRLCQELLDGGVPGLHFYTMNRVTTAVEICTRLRTSQGPLLPELDSVGSR